MLALAPASLPPPGPAEKPGVYPAAGAAGPRRRMALLGGCAEAVLAPQIHEATIRLLNRAGVDVVIPSGEGCCGSLAHHMGEEERALAQARADIDAWTREIEGEGLDAIVVTASGCGATIKDYGHMLRDDPAYAKKAARVAALARDVSEVAGALDLEFKAPRRLAVAYHAACSLQHAQKIVDAPKTLLRRAGFDVRSIPEAHLCCGSAGTYNILQPEIAKALRDRKVANIARRQARRHRRRQHRLPDPDRLGDRNAGRAHRRTPRLGERRPGARGLLDAGRHRAAKRRRRASSRTPLERQALRRAR